MSKTRKISFEESHEMWIEHLVSTLFLNTFIDETKVSKHRVLTYEDWVKDDTLCNGTILTHTHYSPTKKKHTEFVNSDVETLNEWYKRQ